MILWTIRFQVWTTFGLLCLQHWLESFAKSKSREDVTDAENRKSLRISLQKQQNKQHNKLSMFCSVRNGGELEKGEKDYQNNICGPSQFRGLNVPSYSTFRVRVAVDIHVWISDLGHPRRHAVDRWICDIN